MYLYSAYGTACDLSLLMISTVGGVAGVGVYMRCKCKGKEIALVSCCKHSTFSYRKTRKMQIELEQNSEYKGIMKMAPQVNTQNAEPCPAYGVIR